MHSKYNCIGTVHSPSWSSGNDPFSGGRGGAILPEPTGPPKDMRNERLKSDRRDQIPEFDRTWDEKARTDITGQRGGNTAMRPIDKKREEMKNCHSTHED